MVLGGPVLGVVVPSISVGDIRAVHALPSQVRPVLLKTVLVTPGPLSLGESLPTGRANYGRLFSSSFLGHVENFTKIKC